MRLPKEFILIPLIFLLAACASTSYNLQRVERGMTPGEVEAIMGKSHSAKALGKEGSVYTLYRYEDRLCNPSLSFRDTCDFLVIFKSGRVIETVVKEGKSYSPHMPSLSLFQQP
jgi:hypothetical protein